MKINNQHASSFRDPSGYIFEEEGVIRRCIFPIYFKQYHSLKDSGFYSKLFKAGLLIPHKQLLSNDDIIVIEPEQVPFITFPYEWSFNQYKEAALLTLKLQKFCLDHGYSLKDASAFNVVFHKGKAVFIDTLSIDFYEENKPWRAYKQFVTHFLGPLVLASYHGTSVITLMSNYMDGIPAEIIASMLPFKTRFNPTLYTNIHLLAKFESGHSEDYEGNSKTKSLSKQGQLKIIKSLYNYIKGLSLKQDTEWGDYYNKTNYSDIAFQKKTGIINTFLEGTKAKTIFDVGGNNGLFVRKMELDFELALVCDIDNNAVDDNYKQMKSNSENNMLPFVLDLSNPSPSIGFNNKERQSFLGRIKAFRPDVTMALALIHHLSLSNNATFDMSARFFATFSKYLIIEFPKREDSWVQRLLNTKGEFKSHFDFYTLENFEKAYNNYFDIIKKEPISDSERIMYFLKAKS
ncbi:class I SAM-dependent methyltransferase [Hyunsoonleella sp. SJ7]|uniref:Class I SAM-dependent methyltransferase n=1 Tax=Hyunsoonleella aquatilis TaxID=2762758 RepID=A0A923KG35_9FLAO|nr:class I SAM-dependent methyltransferase [Hyunsoonleella aquatilis]MBC3757446.1 class I SAM-dependent methyltransferase [Hyunsoonleella aquatilis]